MQVLMAVLGQPLGGTGIIYPELPAGLLPLNFRLQSDVPDQGTSGSWWDVFPSGDQHQRPSKDTRKKKRESETTRRKTSTDQSFSSRNEDCRAQSQSHQHSSLPLQ